ncbi:MAG: tyrosine-type recombinase/integrase [Fibromonadaceae bacterium]|nr:tyrosine-type recombinase/integrase [Fibromonadaceae bacterium]
MMSIINSVENLKHKLLLMLTYSAGLSASQVVSLKREHINLEKASIKQIVISASAIELFNDYCKKNKIKDYIFESFSNKHLSIRQAQRIFEKALWKAGIFEKISIKSLRDSFAVHLLENGVDIRHIQKILGHKSIKTTIKYSYVAKAKNIKIRSPFE